MSEMRMQLEDWLDDLCVRFIINLPEEDLSSVARICFQVEEAQWFYEDFIRPLDPSLPSMSLRSFCLRIFQHCPLLSTFSADNHMRAFEEFLLYKTRVPVRGAIMLNEAMDSVVLVKGWKKGANWSFPRGKINKDEDDLDCAVREVYEETGYDIKEAGLVLVDEEVKYIEITMREQQMRLYVFRNVPMDTHFEPRTRKEISKIQWYRLSDLPAFRKKGQQQTRDGAEAAVNANKFYMVAPFLVPLKKWVVEQKKKDAQRALSSQYLAPTLVEDVLTEEEQVTERNPHRTSAKEATTVPTPGLDTMEGATAALHRLLKIQPPTQGLQPEAGSAVHSSASKSSGEALLALLHGKPKVSSQRANQPAPPPHIPQDLRYANAPIPDTQHHRPQLPPFSAMPPPPSFQMQPRDGLYPYQARKSETLQQPGSHVMFQQNQMPDLHFPPPQPQGYPQQEYLPQQLQHPQPLPPQVQKAMFTGDQAHGPIVPQLLIQQPMPQYSETTARSVPQPQFPNIHGPAITPATRQTPPKLTSHSLALLKTLKNRDEATTSTDTQNDFPLHRFTEAISGPPAQLQELSADEGVPGRSNIVDMTGINRSASSTFGPQVHPARAIPSDDHRSSLLNMFKASSSKVAGVDLAATITTPADIQHGSEASSSRQPSVDPSFSITSRPAKREPNGRTQPQTHISGPPSPFRPISILARPSQHPVKGLGREESVAMYQHNVASSTKLSLSSEGPTATEQKKIQRDMEPSVNGAKTFQPQILKRPQPLNPSMPAELAAPSPTAFPGFSIQPSLDRRTNQPPEHRQALLSLFKTGLPAASATPLDQPKTTQIPEILINTTANVIPRSRVGSLASAGDDMLSEPSSRRGSQPPISAADKGFLLGYLNTIAKSSGH